MFRMLSAPVLVRLAIAPWLLAATACKDQGPTEDFTTPDAIVKASGDAQVVGVGGTTAPFRVIVFTADDKKCNGCAVHWTLASASGSSDNLDNQTDVTGSAGITVSEAGPAGDFSLTASIANGKQVTFTFSVR